MTRLKELTDSDFRLFRDLIYEQSGISLSEAKKELLRTRLRARLEKEGFKSYKEYYSYVVADDTGNAMVPLLNNISTNLTSFYREVIHFDFLNKIMPGWIAGKEKSGDRTFRVWSAGCSTGEEPYTLAFTMLGHLGDRLGEWSVKILATDIATDVLQKAVEGIYDMHRLKDIPPAVQRKYFKPMRNEKNGFARIAREVRDLVTFRRLNLMRNEFPFKNRFDFIFCRNVMIYFDKPTQRLLVQKFHRYIKPGGYLFIGHSESLNGLEHGFKYIQPTIYRK